MATIAGLPIVNVNDRTWYYNHLIYGQSGVGKTYLAASASLVPEMCPVLFIDIEGGILTLREDFPDVPIVRAQNWQQLVAIIEELRKGVDYKTIIVDSLTEAHALAMAYTIAEDYKKNPDRDMEIPTQRDWGKAGEFILRLVRTLRDLPYNVIMTALESQMKDKDAVTWNTVALPGKLAASIPGVPDIVSYLYVKTDSTGNQARRLLSRPIEKYIVKDRTKKLPLYMDDPTMEHIFKLIGDYNGKEIQSS